MSRNLGKFIMSYEKVYRIVKKKTLFYENVKK